MDWAKIPAEDKSINALPLRVKCESYQKICITQAAPSYVQKGGSALAAHQVIQQYAYLNVDIYRLIQVVRNFVSNAVASFAAYAAVQSDLNYLMVINLSGQVYTLQRDGDHQVFVRVFWSG